MNKIFQAAAHYLMGMDLNNEARFKTQINFEISRSLANCIEEAFKKALSLDNTLDLDAVQDLIRSVKRSGIVSSWKSIWMKH